MENFKKELKNRVVTFKYNKKDGSVREAKGTTNLELIPSECRPNPHSSYTVNESTTRYYDVEKNGWRSFVNDSFVSYDVE